ncbi:MAG: hypothetical protein WED34_09615 [Planctomycetales bacterium]
MSRGHDWQRPNSNSFKWHEPETFIMRRTQHCFRRSYQREPRYIIDALQPRYSSVVFHFPPRIGLWLTPYIATRDYKAKSSKPVGFHEPRKCSDRRINALSRLHRSKKQNVRPVLITFIPLFNTVIGDVW